MADFYLSPLSQQPRTTHHATINNTNAPFTTAHKRMSTPVTTDKWAGVFDCSICRRKRLVGAEFSKKVRRHSIKFE
jgi:hypothetical protein